MESKERKEYLLPYLLKRVLICLELWQGTVWHQPLQGIHKSRGAKWDTSSSIRLVSNVLLGVDLSTERNFRKY